jgi:hypothetical protein
VFRPANLFAAVVCLLPIARLVADEPIAPQVFEDCRQAAAADQGIGEVCPALTAALQDSVVSAQLGAGWKRRIKPAQVADLAWLLQHYAQPPTNAGPDPQALSPALASLHPQATPHQSWWSRLWDWLRRLTHEDKSNAPGWAQALINALRHTPRWFGKAIFYIGLATVLGLIAVLTWREGRILYAERRRARPTARRGANSQPAPDVGITLTEVDAAPTRERPVLLLRLLIQTLVTQQRLSGERALTHTELVTRASLPDPAQRVRLGRLARLAEARRFAADAAFEQQHSGGEIDAVVSDGRALLMQLDAAPHSSAA